VPLFRALAPIVVLVAVALGPAAAQAQEPPAAQWHGPTLAVEAQLGLGAPLGLAGGAIEIAGDWFALSAGLGAGVSGLQVGGTARYRLRLARIFNINIGAGLSAGAYEWTEPFIFDNAARKRWDTAYWANGELGFEFGPFSGFRVRPFVGMGSILNRDDAVCIGDAVGHCEAVHSGDGFFLPYLGVALGYVFIQ
jgi:hypothetical protein